MRGLFQTLSYSVRRLLKNPGLSLIIALSIGLGIGANTTVFTWMESLVLNPYPLVRRPAELMAVNVTSADGRDSLLGNASSVVTSPLSANRSCLTALM
jgi:putative ABC transport system permease protein